MSTHVRIDFDAKKRLERIAEIEGVTLKQALENGITIYELELVRRFTNGERLEPNVIKKVVELREWLRRTHKRQFKEVIKNE